MAYCSSDSLQALRSMTQPSVGGYQGAPISHLMDVLGDASEILAELDVYFENSASEATAAAMSCFYQKN